MEAIDGWHWFTCTQLRQWIQTNCRMEVTEDKMAMVWRQMLLDCQTRTNAEGNTEVRVKA